MLYTYYSLTGTAVEIFFLFFSPVALKVMRYLMTKAIVINDIFNSMTFRC